MYIPPVYQAASAVQSPNVDSTHGSTRTPARRSGRAEEATIEEPEDTLERKDNEECYKPPYHHLVALLLTRGAACITYEPDDADHENGDCHNTQQPLDRVDDAEKGANGRSECRASGTKCRIIRGRIISSGI